jgi:hypothetical protein
MALCADYGIAHSVFMSWDRDDRDKALWWEIHRRDRCPECGTRLDEWDPGKGGHDHAYTAELRKCWGCNTTAAAKARITEEMGAGVHVALVANPEAGCEQCRTSASP